MVRGERHDGFVARNLRTLGIVYRAVLVHVAVRLPEVPNADHLIVLSHENDDVSQARRRSAVVLCGRSISHTALLHYKYALYIPENV